LSLAQQERVNIAVFIDFDNIEIGVKTTLGEHFDIGTVLEALKERGEVVTKIAYADWTRAGEYSRALTQHAIRLVQRNLTPGGDKNGADINLALDALEMAFTHPHINAYVIVGGDSDFLSLVEKLKQYDKKVFVVGGRAFTSVILQRNCHEFIAYENLVRKPAQRGSRPVMPSAASPIAQAFPLVRRALKILADREVSPQTGLLKSTLLQLDSTFSERNYGGSSFLDFTEKLAQAGLVQLKHAGRSVMVELTPGFGDDGETPSTRSDAALQLASGGATIVRAEAMADLRMHAPADGDNSTGAGLPVTTDERGSATGVVQPFRTPGSGDTPPPAGDNAEGAKIAGEVLGAATNARWPMYLRNVKQILRAGGFDERRYGFGGLMDLLRACQREGTVRLERDRRGGLRVLQGAALVRGVMPALESADVALDSVDRTPAEALSQGDETESDVVERTPVAVVDTTAELLGRAKPRRPRTRAAGSPHSAAAGGNTPARGTRRGGGRQSAVAGPSVKKAAAGPRRSRSRKTTTEASEDKNS
jgi:uncharacterized LabA/DUF88 family protein